VDLQTLCIVIIIGGAVAMLVRAVSTAAKRPQARRRRRAPATLALDDALGKLNETIRIIQSMPDVRSPGRHDPAGTRFYIAYLVGIAREVAKMNGVAYGPALETPVRMEIIRLGVPGGADAMRRLLATDEGANGLAAGELDGAEACAPNGRGPYFQRIRSYFADVSVSDDE